MPFYFTDSLNPLLVSNHYLLPAEKQLVPQVAGIQKSEANNSDMSREYREPRQPVTLYTHGGKAMTIPEPKPDMGVA